ncbi:MAG: SpoIID/LytB domain-containing protein [Candidatus Dependentiae bacterium]|nr:SpoIID/LytB domain-containing protein [Candidatus Dependentiae bacterium]
MKLFNMVNKSSKIIKIIALLFRFTSAYAFDVKVLIEKNSSDSSSKDHTVELHCKNGFIISDNTKLSLGYDCSDHNLKIESKNGSLFLNGKPSARKLLYVTPMLSKAHVALLNSYVSNWLKNSYEDLNILAEPLFPLFDQIVVHLGAQDKCNYDLLSLYTKEVAHVFSKDFLSTIASEHSVALETMSDYGEQFFQEQVVSLFIDGLACKELSSKDKKSLKNDPVFRHAFFLAELHHVLQRMLLDFVPALPRKILQQFLQKDVGSIDFKDHSYLGSFVLFQEKKNFYLINSLDIDDYLLSVMHHEGWPGWQHEMNKVFALASRTFLVWHVLFAQKQNKPYHIGNNNQYQTYKGMHNCDKLKKAIEETKDMFISYDGKPAFTEYDICCGGVIPGDMNDCAKVPYLARKYPCTFCSKFKVFSWENSFSYEEVLKRVQKEFPAVKKIVDITVYKKDKAGVARKVLINIGSRKIIITEKKMKSLFPEIKSYCFNLKKDANKKLTIHGKGFGHHRGLCQWGASSLVKDEHWNFVQVLQYYYPGTKLMKLTYQR